MLPFPSAFADWVAATFLPATLGLLFISVVGKKLDQKYLSAFGLGIFLWFFVDTIQGSANLDVVLGLNGGLPQVLEVALFALGLLSISYAGRMTISDGKLSFATLVVAGLALGVHGFGEGSAFGAQAAQTSSSDVVQAFGGYIAAVAYAGHKILEPMMVGALLSSPDFGRTSVKTDLGRVILLGFAFSVPSILGSAAGYYISYDSSYGFALGSGTSILAAALLARVAVSGGKIGTRETLALGGAALLGYILIYGTALLHY